MMTPGRTETCALALPLNAVAIPQVQRLPRLPGATRWSRLTVSLHGALQRVQIVFQSGHPLEKQLPGILNRLVIQMRA